MKIPSQGLGLAEVHRRSRHRSRVAERDEGAVGRKVCGGFELEIVPLYESAAVEVEICVIGEVDYGLRIGLRAEGNPELVLLAPGVTDDHGQIAGISHLAVSGHILELHHPLVLAGLPYLVLETLRTTVEVVRTIIDREAVLHPVQAETACRNAVGVPSRALAQTRTVSKVILRLAVSEHHVAQLAVLVGNVRAHYGGSYVAERHGCARSIGHHILVNRSTIGRPGPDSSLDISHISVVLLIRNYIVHIFQDPLHRGILHDHTPFSVQQI